MKRWIVYHILTWLDIWRLRQSVSVHVIIVAGISLPILLLLGLKNGHVADLRKELLKSPTGREIQVWIIDKKVKTYFSVQECEYLKKDIGDIEFIIPSVQRVLPRMSNVDTRGEEHLVENLTLLSTAPGDPKLKQFGVDVLGTAKGLDKTIVLASKVAEQLHVKVGDTVKAVVGRERRSVKEQADVEMIVGGIFESSDDEVFASVEMLLAIERYVQGNQVKELNWGAFNVAAPDTYAGYLVFCKRGDEFRDIDIRAIGERKYKVRRVEDVQQRTLYGILPPDSLGQLSVYYVSPEQTTNADWGSANLTPRDLTRLTKPDDIAVPWNSAKKVLMNGNPHRVIGLTLPKITWLKQFIDDPRCCFSRRDETFLAAVPEGRFGSETMQLQVADDLTVSLSVRPFKPNAVPPADSVPADSVPADSVPADSVPADSVPADSVPADSVPADSVPADSVPADSVPADSVPADSVPADSVPADSVPADSVPADSVPLASEPIEHTPVDAMTEELSQEQDLPIAVLPENLLAYLYAHDAGKVEFDPINEIFVSLPREPMIAKSRVYATTIDEVLTVVEKFKSLGYATQGDTARIKEIKEQTASLNTLVTVVALGVVFFGIVTVFFVLYDSTERKRSTLGIMRVMGVSKVGTFYTVFLRAAIIGCFAAILTIAVGYVIATLLSWQPPANTTLVSYKPVIQVILTPIDWVIVISVALCCCGVGSLYPAFKASTLDPFDAIVEGRFR